MLLDKCSPNLVLTFGLRVGFLLILILISEYKEALKTTVWYINKKIKFGDMPDKTKIHELSYCMITKKFASIKGSISNLGIFSHCITSSNWRIPEWV